MTNYAFEIRFGVELEDGGGKICVLFFHLLFFARWMSCSAGLGL
jgi:hypothetical protein